MKIQDKYISFETHQLFGKRIAANFVLPVFCFSELLYYELASIVAFAANYDVLEPYVRRYSRFCSAIFCP